MAGDELGRVERARLDHGGRDHRLPADHGAAAAEAGQPRRPRRLGADAPCRVRGAPAAGHRGLRPQDLPGGALVPGRRPAARRRGDRLRDLAQAAAGGALPPALGRLRPTRGACRGLGRARAPAGPALGDAAREGGRARRQARAVRAGAALAALAGCAVLLAAPVAGASTRAPLPSPSLLDLGAPPGPPRDLVLQRPNAAAARAMAQASATRYPVNDGHDRSVAIAVSTACQVACTAANLQQIADFLGTLV